ncbi:MAG: DUF2752 domain-containing protein [Acidobacteria bacterium]|nr:DUF2752 domain-containing protein [Acidobacteriota bacterium]
MGFVVAIAAFQLVLTASGLTGWECPLLKLTGWPCPGCGLTRAVLALLHGEWKKSLTLHAFAPILLAALALIGIASFLPQQQRQRLADTVENIEKRTRLSAVLLIGFVVYWLIRLLLPASLVLVTQK